MVPRCHIIVPRCYPCDKTDAFGWSGDKWQSFTPFATCLWYVYIRYIYHTTHVTHFTPNAQHTLHTLHQMHNTPYTLYTKSHHHLTLYKYTLSSQHTHQFSNSLTHYIHSHFESTLGVLELQERQSRRGLEEETSIIYHQPQLSSSTNKFLWLPMLIIFILLSFLIMLG